MKTTKKPLPVGQAPVRAERENSAKRCIAKIPALSLSGLEGKINVYF